jgi:hypothetical protein
LFDMQQFLADHGLKLTNKVRGAFGPGTRHELAQGAARRPASTGARSSSSTRRRRT